MVFTPRAALNFPPVGCRSASVGAGFGVCVWLFIVSNKLFSSGLSRGLAPRRDQRSGAAVAHLLFELELELIRTQMAQKPMLRVEVGARALRNPPL